MLEKFIKENKESFDTRGPSDDLWLKIQSEIQDKNKAKAFVGIKKNKNSLIFKIAAIIAFFGISVWFFSNYNSNPNAIKLAEIEKQNLDPALNELIEAQAFYKQEVNQRLEDLDKFGGEFASIKKDVLTEFANLDSSFNELKQDLGEDIYNQEVVEAMIQNYRIKLDILEEIWNQFQKNNNKNETKNEIKHS